MRLSLLGGEMLKILKSKRSGVEIAGVIVLLLILCVQLFLSIRQQTQTWDEADHIFAGYMSLKNADFGLNPEHPPLVKILATASLQSMSLKVPELQNRNFKEEAFLSGKDFLYGNDADAILLRVRLTAAIFTLLCAIFVFLGTKEMFGTGAAFVALALLIFDPNLIAHGAYVTTDVGASCFMFATIYAFYRYVKAPSWQRLLLVGLALGLALATKHSCVLLFPILLILAIIELLRGRFADKDSQAAQNLGKQALRFILSLAGITVISLVILWAFYGFRYQARPAGLELNPTLAQFTQQLSPGKAWLINTPAQLHLLPESYLYGMADILMTSYNSYVLGKVYPHSVWFYFPVVFVIKSTIGFLLLFLLTLSAIVTRRLNCWREVLFLTIPPIFYFLVAMSSGTNIGVRHLLPVYVFLFALAGGAAWAFVNRSRKWGYAVAALLLFHIVSSVLVLPHYIPYSNELWGGSGNTWKYLSDSNIDWAQQLRETKQYLDAHGIKDCWFVYFGEGIADRDYYGIPCKPLLTADSLWINEKIQAPPSIDGTVLISAADLTGFEFGPGKLNPYEQFKDIKPKDMIGNEVFVFEGHFELPLASALSRAQNAQELLRAGQTEVALSEAQSAVALASESASVRTTLGDVLTKMGRTEEARAQYEQALQLAKTIEPEFQGSSISILEQKLSGK
jgi:4-amino-4-deoxy-L-arabinose transferase-like glycosyltransferase